MFLITGSYGEWDDFTRHSILVVSDEDTAELVVQEMNRPNNQFIPLLREIFDKDRFDDVSFSYDEIMYFHL